MVDIVRAQKDELDEVVEVINENIPLAKRITPQKARSKDLKLYVLKMDGKIIGCCGIRHRTQNACELVHGVVEKEYRGKGFGRKMIEFMIEEGFKDYNKLFMTVNANNEPALKLASSMGFVEEGLLKHHFKQESHVYILSKFKHDNTR